MNPSRSLFLATIVGRSLALDRTVGDPTNVQLQSIASQCLNSTPDTGFSYGKCPSLMRCVLDAIPSELSAGMQSGSNIASLVPTTLALIGVSPLNIVKLAFVSPLRGLVLSIFGIGLPQSLFRQLTKSPSSTKHDTGAAEISQPNLRRWVVPVPEAAALYSIKGPLEIWPVITMKAILIDTVVLALLAVMLWQNSSLGLRTMVTWRCDYSFLLICWPISCFLWLVIAMTSLLILAKEIRIRYSEDPNGLHRTWLELVQLTYKLPRAKYEEEEIILTASNSVSPPLRANEPAFYIDITMRFNKAWEFYETGIEALAVGIYLYATFVLTSSIFVSGETGITYMTLMVCCLTVIRVLVSIG